MRLSYSFTVIDSSGRSTTTDLTEIDVVYHSVEQKLEHRVNDTTIASYSLLLFNFDSPRMSASDQNLVSLIAEAVEKKAFVRLIGYTDSLGEQQHNHELAMARAREVAKMLTPLVPNDVRIVVDESGGERERFPYITPEGRSHCRTVVIEVRTPTFPGEEPP
jgi:outer membrane protein OmpA-like peptidoglycan-associated protein